MTAPEHWTIPPQKQPVPAVMKRIGPKPQFKPSVYKRKRPEYHRSIPMTFAEMHAERGTKQDKCRDHMTKPARKHRDSWSEEECQRLKQLKEDGYGAEEIAEIMGRSRAAVYKRIQRIGAADKRNRWTEARLNVVRDLLRQGWTDAQIAEEMGMTGGAINKVVN